MNGLVYSFENKSFWGVKPSLELLKKKSSCPQPQFGGVTGTLQDRHWVSPETFQKALGVSSTPYIGKLPPVFVSLMKETQESPKQVFQALDELAPILRQLSVDEAAFTCRIGRSKKPLTLQYIGNGSYGTVYALTVKNQSMQNQTFALKVYHKLDQVTYHGTFGESSTGLYLGKRPMKDIAQFYFGNPKAGWGVYELITSDMRSNSRPGQSIHSLPLTLGDEGGGNSISDIRVDYGGILPKVIFPNGVEMRNLEDFKKIMACEGPAVQARATARIPWLSENSREEAFQLAIATPEPIVRESAASIIYSLPDYAINDAFQRAMATHEPRVQANAASKISYLPKDNILAAYQLVMDTQDPTVQASAASIIRDLPENFRKKAFQLAMETQKPTVQAGAASAIIWLPDDFRKEAYLLAMATQDPQVQESVASRIPCLPSDFRKEAFLLAMASKSLATQAGAASRIPSLPKDYRKEAFLLAMATQEPSVQASAISGVYWFPEDFKKEAFRLAIATKNPTVHTRVASVVSYLPKEFRKEAIGLYVDAVVHDQQRVRILKEFCIQ
ncbi:MAG: hypothetical protein K2X66_02705 [Cyanobacteria bacterium]|nr:hypothetical protein [Cyanobacteriota bacterium]